MKSVTGILLVCSIVTLAGILYILFQLNTNMIVALNMDQTDLTIIHYFLVFSILFVVLFHPFAFVYILMHFRRFEELRSLKIFLLILGVISFFSLGGEKVMVDEIVKQFRAGLSTDELKILNIYYIINAVFSLCMFLLSLKTFNLIHADKKNNKSIDERIFVTAQILGIVSGITGLLFVFHNIFFIDKDLLNNKFWVFIPFYLMFLSPYGLAVLYWLSLKRKQKIREWYDEKQLQDVFRSSLTTLILSIPGLAILLLLKVPVPFYFLLYYIFLILLIFSGSTLYFFKIRDIH